MPDLGSIARWRWASLESRRNSLFSVLRGFMLDGRFVPCEGKSSTEGNPSAPCLRMESSGVHEFKWAVSSGSRTISVDVKQAVNQSPRPSLRVMANPDIGVNSDSETSASLSTGWVTIGPVSLSPTSTGALIVHLKANFNGQFGNCPCFFDHIVVT